MDASPSYLVDVRSILEDLGASLSLDSDVDLPELSVGSETFRPLGPAHVVASVTNTGAGIVVSGMVTVVVEAVCSRCLRDFALEVSADLDAFFVQPGEDSEIPEEQEIAYIREGSIDLMEQILPALALELPFAPVHSEDCPGICPQCGADLTEGPCDCAPDRSDSPFASLKDLFGPEEES